jgi:predicted aldo/keto reductase-like oxidoreductase
MHELAELLVYAHGKGVTFWDLADQYGSHANAALALAQVDRSSVVLTSKTCAKTGGEAAADIDRFLRETRSEQIDILLMHCLTVSDWPERFAGVMEALARAKEAGKIRAHGVSCHDFEAFEVAADEPWVDVVLARINHGGHHMDGPPEKIVPILDRMARNGKGVYGMKVVGQGKLDTDVRSAIHYVLELPSVHAVTIGMGSRREVEENVGWVEEYQLALV